MSAAKRFRRLTARKLPPRLRAVTRRRRKRTVETVYETPISMRSKLAVATIALMVAIIIAAAVRVHPTHLHAVYNQVPVDANPYMGVLDADGGYLISAPLSWRGLVDQDEAYVWESGVDPFADCTELTEAQRYVALLDADAPDFVTAAAQESENADEYTASALRVFVEDLCRYMAARGDCAYLQTDAALDGMPAEIDGIYLLCLNSDGLYRSPGGDFTSYLRSPVAGNADGLYSGHLTYLTEPTDEDISGRVGYAIGVLDAEWHQYTRPGYRLFVNITLNNAGVAPVYRDYELRISLWRGGALIADQPQTFDVRQLEAEPESVDCFIDVPYDTPDGTYSIRVAVCDRATGLPAIALTMTRSHSGYYELGQVMVKQGV